MGTEGNALCALLRQPDGSALLFRSRAAVVARAPSEVPSALQQLERELAAGRTLALALSYELGHLLAGPPLPWPDKPHVHVSRPPLIWALAAAGPRHLGAAEADAFLQERERETSARLRMDGARLLPLTPLLNERQCGEAFDRIQRYIAAGDVYQVNFTFPLIFRVAMHPARLLRAMLRQQLAPHAAYLELSPTLWALSASPELFLELTADGGMHSRPMKGTAPRDPDPQQDAANAEWLRSDAKTRAENLMITDLMRNDLGRVAEMGSVRVPALHVVESYPTVHQMVSEVRARMRPGVGLAELLRALLPAGSITGAPKRRAMEIIDELEAHARGLYTGCIGWLRRTPQGRYEGMLSVVIRTVIMDDTGCGRMGIGAGLVADSQVDAEYAECLLKGRFLQQALAAGAEG